MRKEQSYVRKYGPIMGEADAKKFYRYLQQTAARASAVARLKKKHGV